MESRGLYTASYGYSAWPLKLSIGGFDAVQTHGSRSSLVCDLLDHHVDRRPGTCAVHLCDELCLIAAVCKSAPPTQDRTGVTKTDFQSESLFSVHHASPVQRTVSGERFVCGLGGWRECAKMCVMRVCVCDVCGARARVVVVVK